MSFLLIRKVFSISTDLIMVMRPVILIPVWGFAALGFRAAISSSFRTGFFDCWKSATIYHYGTILLFSLSVAAVYIINQLADIEVDKKNGGLPLIASGIVSVHTSVVLLILCSFISIVLPLFISDIGYSIASMCTVVIGFIYSVKPIRLSGRPFGDFISNAFGYGGIAFAVGWMATGKSPFSFEFISKSLPYFFLMSAGSISSTIPDMKGDKEDQKITTAVYLGVINAHTLACICLLIALCTAVLAKDVIAISCVVLCFPMYIGYYFNRKQFFLEATYKLGGVLCMFASFLSLPLFFPCSIVVFILTWLYFRIRHGVSYPTLSPVSS